jgi:hypothetical protein
VPKEFARATCGPGAACVTSLPAVARNIQCIYLFIYLFIAALNAEYCALGGVMPPHSSAAVVGLCFKPYADGAQVFRVAKR